MNLLPLTNRKAEIKKKLSDDSTSKWQNRTKYWDFGGVFTVSALLHVIGLYAAKFQVRF